jgi:cell division protein FtsL
METDALGGFTIFMSIITFVAILILFTLIVYMYGRLVDTENNISSLFEYRKYNEVQLQNLIKDVNKNDSALYEQANE